MSIEMPADTRKNLLKESPAKIQNVQRAISAANESGKS